uniref:Mutator-like transposase domain-containing protein n=1 Tax=Sipha flava TaxID=143950 RepID=A0A2S2PWB5_9HEMI
MPVMSNNKYQLLHNEVASTMNDISWEEIELAGKEEATIAIQNNVVDSNGRPMIAVIADGTWSKRSYKTKYNALSGVRASKNHMDPKDHICFKNWNLLSTAMEADIIVEGFKRSFEMHNFIYSRLIAAVTEIFIE